MTNPSETYGRYSLTREYTKGGIGRVWLARDGDLHRDVILKELRPQQSENQEARQRFLKEAQVTGQLEHPNIVPVYELGRESKEERPFYTMRLIRGETLREAIAEHHRRRREGKEDPLEGRRLLTVFVSVCNAIAYAHARGVLHRDLKPDNVVLGKFGEVILLDWGLAKLLDKGDSETSDHGVSEAADPHTTSAGSVVGTPAYMAPEQAEGTLERLSFRTDIYGLGAVLFEVLTGRPPHVGASVTEMIRRIVREGTPRARAVRRSIPSALDAICFKAMAKEPGERYAKASDLADEVQRWLADEPVSVYREPLHQRVRRWSRHNRTWTAAALVVLVAATVLVSTTWRQRANAIDKELEMLGKETQQGIGRLNALIDILRKDVRYLTDQQAIDEIFRSPGNATPESMQETKDRLATVFVEFLRHRPSYFQARLIGGNGWEIVRVEREPSRPGHVASADPERAPDTTLQDKGRHEYFERSIGLAKNEVYLSRVELNKEGGRVDPRHIPVIRAAVAVHREGEEKAVGVVVINLDFRSVFDMLVGNLKPLRSGNRTGEVLAAATPQGTSSTGGKRFVYVTNHEGYFLWNADHPEKVFGFDLPPAQEDRDAYLIQETYPELREYYEGSPGSDDGWVVSGAKGQRRAVFVHKLRYDPRNGERFLGLAVAAPYQELVDRAKGGSPFSLYLTLALMIGLVGLAMTLSRRRVRGLVSGN